MANKWLDNLKDLWDRLTAARAGYIDELDFDLNARLGTPAGASLAADLLTIENLVDDLETAVGTIEGATTLHNKLTAARAALLDGLIAARLAELDAANIPADIDTLLARLTAVRASYLDNIGDTAVGRNRAFTLNITSAANAGAVTVATITTQACKIKSIVVRSNGATTADLTNITITGGAGTVVTFIDSVTGIRANIAAVDQEVAWVGAASLPATKTIIITLTGTGATAVNLQVDIEYEAIVAGGYLA